MTPPRRPSSLSLAQSAFAVAVVLLSAGSQVSSSLHRAFVEHEVCAEHGEVVHGAAGLGETGEPSSGVSAGVPAEAHGHDHCLIAALRDEVGLPEGVEAGASPAEISGAVEGDVSPGHPPREPLALAPKASPPV